MDIENFTKNASQSISSSIFGDLFLNPIYVSSLITISVLLIILFMYNENRLVKTSFYIMCATTLIVFIHNKLLLIEHKKQLCNKDMENICSTIGAGPVVSGGNDSSTGGLGYLSM